MLNQHTIMGKITCFAFWKAFWNLIGKGIINTFAYNSFAHTSGKDPEEDIAFRAPKLGDFVHSEEILRGDAYIQAFFHGWVYVVKKMKKSRV